MRQLIARILVIVRALPTYLVVAATVLGIVIDELDDVAGIPQPVVATLIAVAGVLAIAITIIRRVTPVLEQARGLLTVDGPVTAGEATLEADLKLARSQYP